MNESAYAVIEVESRGATLVARFRCQRIYDDLVIRDVARDLLALVDQPGARVVVDFAGVEFLASAMLGKLITVQRRVRNQSGRLALCGLESSMVEVFAVSKLDSYFEIYSGIDEAVAALAA